MTTKCQVVTEHIAAPAPAVYQYARNVATMPEWAAGLASGVQLLDGRWTATSPLGNVTIDMAERNSWGVMDHVVTLPDGRAMLNAFRVSPVGEHSVVTFVVLRQPGMGDDEFHADVDAVRRDLRALKHHLEAAAGN